MTAVFSQDISPAIALTAAKVAPITAPLFDPVYSIINNAAVTFTRSSPWPHFMMDFRRQTNGAITYEKSQVLSPFNVATLTWGSTATGTATGNAHAAFVADKDIITSGGTFVYHPNNSFAVAGGNQTNGVPGAAFTQGATLGTGPSYRQFEPFFVWDGAASGEWAFSKLKYCLDYLTFDNFGNECDVMLGFPVVSGSNPIIHFGALTQNFFAWHNAAITAKITRLTNAFSNGIGKNIYAIQLNAAVAGTALYLLSFDGSGYPAGSSSNIVALTFDDPNIQTLVNAGNYTLQGTNFGWLLSWSKATYELIKGQGCQTILLTCTVDPDGNTIRSPTYAPIIFKPNTTKSSAAISIVGEADVKIDPNGILYYRAVGAGSDPTYVANSYGLDITIPGVTVDQSKLATNLALPSFCPCSPVAIDVPG